MIHIKPGVNITNISSLMKVAIQKTYEQFVRYNCNMVITSATRNPTDNKAVNGIPNSRHLYGLAIDVRIWELPNKHVFRDELAQTLKPFGYDVILEDDHIHIEYEALVTDEMP
jgi:uncharacterized protein YcbK (DUF882 family)